MVLFVLSFCPFDTPVGVGAFVIGLSQISYFFSFLSKETNSLRGYIKSVIRKRKLSDKEKKDNISISVLVAHTTCSAQSRVPVIYAHKSTQT